jgi:hypothetical protein
MPLIQVAINFYQTHPDIFTTQDVVYSLQMSYHWYSEAAQIISDLMAGEADARLPGSVEEYPEPPQFNSSREMLEYLLSNLKSVQAEAHNLRLDLLLPPAVLEAFNQGTVCVTQAKFSTIISREYYESQARYLASRGIDTRST